ncbi:MAG: hypothetical protein HRT47_13590 [Candidatus Caenarcaniphilales bacterium]|nr:hypothetical protein [Candidatus Caenarcaniphilales bacterium]
MNFRSFLLTIFLFSSGILNFGFNSTYYSAEAKQEVYYNTKSHIYHNLGCRWAKACTVNCILIDKADAIQRGRACKVCGG